MGYFEIYCQICGVSFAIARMRTREEPEEASWEYTGTGFPLGEDEQLQESLDEQTVERNAWSLSISVAAYRDRFCRNCTIVPRSDHHGGSDCSEHVAGPGCVCSRAYAGSRISLEEMEGCRKVQALCPKNQVEDWEPQEDDEQFEISGTHFLTGYGYGSPDTAPLWIVENVRHNLEDVMIGNTWFNEFEWAIPFHPTCFTVYRRAYVSRTGQLDVQGFVDWSESLDDFGEFHSDFPRDPAVRRSREQWWQHHTGDEWLVANPIKIPGLSEILDSYQCPISSLTGTSASYEFASSPVNVSSDTSKVSSHQGDFFTKLPREIFDAIIIDYLSSNDLANLRLATRAARQIPNVVFRRFIVQEMPWFWEARETMPVTADWLRLYSDLKKNYLGVKGLRNRARIWKDVNYILERIATKREDGLIA